MSFHESFWVTVGTAAPVIALAAIVSLPDVFLLENTAIALWTPRSSAFSSFP